MTTPDSPLAATFVQARNYRVAARDVASLIVIHSTEGAGSAASIASWFASAGAPMASAHYVVDRTGVVQCVRERDIAWHAPGVNATAIGIELCGFAHWSDAEWRASGVLEPAAALVADICSRRCVPASKLEPSDLLAGHAGICGHVDVTNAFQRSTHWDPGPGFPWDHFIALVNAATP